MTARRALVIGGSLGGLIAAHLLRSTGWDAVVFERNAEELASRGVGLGTHPQLIAILRRAGIAFDETMGIKVPKVICLDRDGKTIVEQPTSRIMSGWSRLYRALRDALPARKLSARKDAAPHRAGRRRRHRDLCGRHARARRHIGGRRRHTLDRARAILAAGATRLCRLCRLARSARRSPGAARHLARDFRASTRSVCRKASNCSAIRCPDAITTPRLAAAATISSGTGRPMRQRSPICAPMRRAATTRPAFHRR